MTLKGDFIVGCPVKVRELDVETNRLYCSGENGSGRVNIKEPFMIATDDKIMVFTEEDPKLKLDIDNGAIIVFDSIVFRLNRITMIGNIV